MDDIINEAPRQLLRAPPYTGTRNEPGMVLGVKSLERHMTDEAHQLEKGLAEAGYLWAGGGLPIDCTDVPRILRKKNPAVVFVKDKREIEGITADHMRDAHAVFHGIEELRNRDDIFKVSVLKDAHQKPKYHRQALEEIGCHAVACYYHPKLVKHWAPYVREEHLIRIYHSVDAAVVPPFKVSRTRGVAISGAVHPVPYPLRSRLAAAWKQLPQCSHFVHPGYHRHGCCTPGYLRTLSDYKVSVCTASIYGYALRKLFEATAVGCMVLTNLPEDDVLPEIDGNLTRIDSEASIEEVAGVLQGMLDRWNPDAQEHWARKAVEYYDYRASGRRLAADIEKMRLNWEPRC